MTVIEKYVSWGEDLGCTPEMMALQKSLKDKGYIFTHEYDSPLFFAGTRMSEAEVVSKEFFAKIHFRRLDGIVLEINYASQDRSSDSIVKMQEWYKKTLSDELASL